MYIWRNEVEQNYYCSWVAWTSTYDLRFIQVHAYKGVFISDAFRNG